MSIYMYKALLAGKIFLKEICKHVEKNIYRTLKESFISWGPCILHICGR